MIFNVFNGEINGLMRYLSTLILCFTMSNLTCQESSLNISKDSLIKYDYTQLKKLFKENEEDSIRATEYLNYYFKKARREKDSIRIAEAFYLLAKSKKDQNAITFLDSVINYTKNSNHFEFPSKAYNLKGTLLYKLGKNKEALDYYILAYNNSITSKNVEQQASIDYKIGVLKNDLGDYNDALKSFKSYYKYLTTYYQNDSIHSRKYLKILFAIADSYMRLEKLDSTNFIINKAFKISDRSKDKLYHPYVILLSGSTAYYKKQYKTSRDSIFKALPYLETRNDFGNISVSHLFIGKGYYDQGNYEKALLHFNKVDSIFEEKKYVYPEIREVYEKFIDFHKSQNDKEKQLHFLEKLVQVDSILNNEYKYVSKNIEKKYNTSQLLIEKENLVQGIKKEKKKTTFWIVLLCSFLILTTSFSYGYYIKQKRLKKKINQYLNREKEAPFLNKTLVKTTQNQTINLSPDVVKEIRNNLRTFERKNQFLDKNLTQKDVANLIGTNSTYLSKVVNHYEGKNFAVYINDLRIEYAIKEIKKNSKIRKFSIKYISEEVGFSNTESFSKAFHRKTGLYPSVFIKNIEKIKDQENS